MINLLSSIHSLTRRKIYRITGSMILLLTCGLPVLQAQQFRAKAIDYSSTELKKQSTKNPASTSISSLEDYEVFKLDVGAISKFMDGKESVNIEISLGSAHHWNLQLEHAPTRSREVTQSAIRNGEKVELKKLSYQAFTATTGEGATVNMLLRDQFMYLKIKDDQETYALEPARNFDLNLPQDHFIFHKPTNSSDLHAGACSLKGEVPSPKKDKGSNTGLEKNEDCYWYNMVDVFNQDIWNDERPEYPDLSDQEFRDEWTDELVTINHDVSGLVFEFNANLVINLTEVIFVEDETAIPGGIPDANGVVEDDALRYDLEAWLTLNGVLRDGLQCWTLLDLDVGGNTESIGSAYTPSNCAYNGAVINEYQGSLLNNILLSAHEIGHTFGGEHEDARDGSLMSERISDIELFDFSNLNLANVLDRLESAASNCVQCCDLSFAVEEYIPICPDDTNYGSIVVQTRTSNKGTQRSKTSVEYRLLRTIGDLNFGILVESVVKEVNSQTTDIVVFDLPEPGTYFVRAFDLEYGRDCRATTQRFTTSVDNSPPNLTCFSEVTISTNPETGVSMQASDFAQWSDDCAIAQATVIWGESPERIVCEGVGDATITVTDVNGNSSSCTTRVEVINTLPPVAKCRNTHTVYLDNTGQGWLRTRDVDDGSFDECDIVDGVLSQDYFTCADVGDNTVTLTLTDDSGNTASCTSTIIVEDNVSPKISCKDISRPIGPVGTVYLNPNDVINSVSDACQVAGTTISQSRFNCTDIGNNSVTATVYDFNGNSSSCTAIVTISVGQAVPTVSCQDVTVELGPDGTASILEGNILSSWSYGSCSDGGTFSLDVRDVNCSNIGSNQVELTLTNDRGYSSSCSATVEVLDNTPPIARCKDLTLTLDENGQAPFQPIDLDSGSSDNCGILSFAISDGPVNIGNCGYIGGNSVNLTVFDHSGNRSTCNARVRVIDNMPPVAKCKDLTLTLDATGHASIPPPAGNIDNGSFDNCGLDTPYPFLLSDYFFDCSEVGANTITQTVTDQNGLSSTCTGTVTVVDATPPIAQCQDVTIQLDADGNASIAGAQLDSGSSDACGIGSFSASPSSFDCSHIGTNTVTLTVMDNSGNNSTCTAAVTVEDNVAPILSCPADITVDNDPGDCGASVDFTVGLTDNCVGSSSTGTAASGDFFAVGTTTVDFSAIDANGNTASCSFDIIVNDSEAPVIEPTLLFLECINETEGDIYEVSGIAEDNCGVASESFFIALPDMESPTPSFKKKTKKKLKFQLSQNKVTIEAPGEGGAAAWWAELQAQGGVMVTAGQQLELTGEEGAGAITYQFSNDGELNRVVAASLSLIQEAIDLHGVTGRATVTAVRQCHEIEALQGTSPELEQTPFAQNLVKDQQFKQLNIYPNPFKDQLRLEFFSTQAGQLSIDVFNLQGQRVSNLFQGQVEAGEHLMHTWNGRDGQGVQLPAGMYLIQLRMKDEILNKRVLLQRD